MSANRCVQALASRLSPLTDIGAFGAAQLDADERQLKSSVRSLAPSSFQSAPRAFSPASCLLPPRAFCLRRALNSSSSCRVAPCHCVAPLSCALLRCAALRRVRVRQFLWVSGVASATRARVLLRVYCMSCSCCAELNGSDRNGTDRKCSILRLLSSPFLSVAFRFSIAQWELDAVTSCSQCSVQYVAVDSL